MSTVVNIFATGEELAAIQTGNADSMIKNQNDFETQVLILNSTLSNLQQNFSTFAQEFRSESTANTANLISTIEGFSVDITQVFNNSNDEVKNAINNSSEVSNTNINKLITDLSGAIHQSSSNNVAEISQLTSEIKNSIDSSTTKSDENINKLITDLSGAIHNSSSNNVAEISQLTSELKNAIQTSTNTSNDNINKLITDLSGAIHNSTLTNKELQILVIIILTN
jgi:hypothetical protein